MLHWLEQLQNIQRELHQHSWEHFKRARYIDPACPLSWVCDQSIFSCTNKARSFNQNAENMVSTLKHRIITEKNNESSTEMTINHIQFWTIFSMDIQCGRNMSVMTSQTPAIWPFFNSMTWLTAKETCKLSYSRRNQLWYITLVLMEPPLRSFCKSMTAKEGLKSPPDRLFVQKYFLVN